MDQSMRPQTPPPSVHALVVAAQAGSAEAFTALARPLADRLYAIAYRILRDADQAEDATQRALVDTWQHLGELRDPDRFEAWTCRTVVRAAYREIRQLGRLTTTVRQIAVPAATDPDPAASLADRDELERGFRRLSAEHRAVLVLHHYLGFSAAEIADVMGVPAGTVGSRIHYALASLRAAIEADARTSLVTGRVTS
jgi:RNA polymerase sigma-70 factor (ECF subfamily)